MIWSAYIFEVTVNKKRMCEGGYGPVAFWMRIFARFFISIFVSFSLSSFASGEFQCELPVISFSAADILRVSRIYAHSVHAYAEAHACMHASMYEDIRAYFATTTAHSMTTSRLPRENCEDNSIK